MSEPHSITALPGSQVALDGELAEIANAPYEKGQQSIETDRAVFDIEKVSRQKATRMPPRPAHWRLVGWLTVKGVPADRTMADQVFG